MHSTDDHSNYPFLNDALDSSRYPILKKLPCNDRRRSLFTVGSPKAKTHQRSRNVSEPLLVSSTNYLRESWFASFASPPTIGDLPGLSNDDGDDTDTFVTVCSNQSTTVACDTASASSLQNSPSTLCGDSSDISTPVKASDLQSEVDSLYSTDSADQDAHPLLLSMPIIPQIRLERMATVRKPDPAPRSDAVQNQTFLSPRNRGLQASAKVSSRRHGRIFTRASQPCEERRGHAADIFRASRRFGSTGPGDTGNRTTRSTYTHSASEPTLNSSHKLVEEEPLRKKGSAESLPSDVLLCMIDEAGSLPSSYSDGLESGVDTPLLPKQVPLERSPARSSLSYSISFSGFVHAIADGYAALELFLRKPKSKPKFEGDFRSNENAHDPTSKWAPKQGQIIVKVFVPSTDDIWKFRVPQDVTLADFTSRVISKLGFSVSFSGSLWDEPKYHFRTDECFKAWVKGRVRFGRNLPIVAHVPHPLPLMRLCVDRDGCEVWCYA